MLFWMKYQSRKKKGTAFIEVAFLGYISTEGFGNRYRSKFSVIANKRPAS